MQEFFTRKAANEGKKVPLYLPNGEKSDHWLIVRGVDSDEFKLAESKAKRNAINLAQIEDENERIEAVRTTELESIAALIANWSFNQKCTPDNVVKFLREAPQIADMVNRYAANRKGFFA